MPRKRHEPTIESYQKSLKQSREDLIQMRKIIRAFLYCLVTTYLTYSKLMEIISASKLFRDRKLPVKILSDLTDSLLDDLLEND